MDVCPHCGGDLSVRQPARLDDVVGPERMQELVEAARRSQEEAARRRRQQIWRRAARRGQ